VHIGTYKRLGVTVFASDREVIRAASRKLKRAARLDRKHGEAPHAFQRQMLTCHHAALELVIRFHL
jgi:hypothetical protein